MKFLKTTLLAAAGVTVVLAAPASAQVPFVPVDFAGMVTAGTELVLTCPDGYFVQRTAEGQPNAGASFYRKVRKNPVAEGVASQREITDPDGTAVGVAWLVPKGAHYADGALWCTVPEFTGSWSESPPYPTLVDLAFNCHAGYPYLVSVIRVEGDADADLNTTADRYPLDYTTTSTGIVIGSIQEGHRWFVEMTCSVKQPITA